jgi:xanthine/uracil permease
MCDVCVMNSVKERMLSRRSFFRTSAAAIAAATLGASATPTFAQSGGVVDMTNELSVVVSAPKTRGGAGGPARIFALV